MAPGPVASVLHTPASPTWMDSSYTRRLLRTLSPGPFCERPAESWTAGFPPLAALPQGLWPQLGKCLYGKPKDLSSDPQHTFQSWMWWPMPAIPMLGEVQTDPWGLRVDQSTLIGEVQGKRD